MSPGAQPNILNTMLAYQQTPYPAPINREQVLEQQLHAARIELKKVTDELQDVKASIAVLACVPAVMGDATPTTDGVMVRVSVPAFELSIPMVQVAAARENDPRFASMVGYAAMSDHMAPVPLAELFKRFEFHDAASMRWVIGQTYAEVLRNIGGAPIVVVDEQIAATLDSFSEKES